MVVDTVGEEDIVELLEVRIVIINEEGLVAIRPGNILGDPNKSKLLISSTGLVTPHDLLLHVVIALQLPLRHARPLHLHGKVFVATLRHKVIVQSM